MRTQSICLALVTFLLCPFASAQWVRANFPHSIAASCLAISGDVLIAGTYDRGVFISTNQGTNWTAANQGLPKDSYYDVYAPIWCVASSGQNLFAGTDAGIFLTTDNGTSWNAANNGVTDLHVYDLPPVVVPMSELDLTLQPLAS